MVKFYLNLSIFTVFLKNKNIIFKIRRSKVTDYAALNAQVSTATDNEGQFVPSKFKALVSAVVWTKRDNLASISKAQRQSGTVCLQCFKLKSSLIRTKWPKLASLAHKICTL